jgi:hypothetical protein
LNGTNCTSIANNQKLLQIFEGSTRLEQTIIWQIGLKQKINPSCISYSMDVHPVIRYNDMRGGIEITIKAQG